MIKKTQAKLTLTTETVRQLDALTSAELARAAGGVATGLGMCTSGYTPTLYCSAGGGRGTCTLE